MLYKPTYCCDCGERIERSEWKIWTNRRFCELCETEHKFDDVLRYVSALGLVFVGIIGVGSYLSTGTRTIEISKKDEAQTFEISNKRSSLLSEPTRSQGTAPAANIKDESGDSDDTRKPTSESSETRQRIENSTLAPAAQTQRVQKISSEPVYFCGAATKKGNPCSRRVKGGGRCWQHKGKEAILPENKLLIKE